MYAIFRSGGKQYQAVPGGVLRIERIPGEIGETVTFDQVLTLADGDQVDFGKPVLADCSVTARIVEQNRARKIVIFKHKRRKDYRKKQGHRQYYTAVRVESIGAPERALPEAPVEASEE
ncbi:MAG: 50S ribosomal protein L21 [Syntrophobacteraceae bacterium]|jgi:large subunit ribosomal protein L21|nr:50S ribosomal protein L21 [Syntrophobacteraceae bacterium]